ncbi:hypothetical protein NE865_04711 [Phthorimaea operculella]|nr:hypothetical protein NE865_04711 [Phthorimaea operculella]
MFCEIPDFGRCCFCMPLRRGVLVFGYLGVLFAAFMIGVYSYYVHYDVNDEKPLLFIKGVATNKATGFCVAVYCFELIVNCLLVYGAHVKNILFLKIFYYYTVTTTVAALALQIVEFAEQNRFFEILVFDFAVLCINLYLLFLVRSLFLKLEKGSNHSYNNQLHTIVVGDEPVTRVENGVYNNTTVAPAPDKDDF